MVKGIQKTDGLDVVYILGTGSKWNDNEIRFSLRSIEKNLPHARVFIVGEKPQWLTNVIHIPAEDPFDHKLKNGIHKITTAAKDERISEKFILMNDDFFILEKLEGIRLYYRQTLADMRRKHPTKQGYYFEAIDDTRRILKNLGATDAMDYSVHYPIIFEKKKILDLVKKVQRVRCGYLFRTVYCNYYKLGGYKRNDVKVKDIGDLRYKKFREIEVLSTNDRMVLSKTFQSWVIKKFPKPSDYERDWQEFQNVKKTHRYGVTQRFTFGDKVYNDGDIIEGVVDEKIVRMNGLKLIAESE